MMGVSVARVPTRTDPSLCDSTENVTRPINKEIKDYE
jgi:hypothetical protein